MFEFETTTEELAHDVTEVTVHLNLVIGDHRRTFDSEFGYVNTDTEAIAKHMREELTDRLARRLAALIDSE